MKTLFSGLLLAATCAWAQPQITLPAADQAYKNLERVATEPPAAQLEPQAFEEWNREHAQRTRREAFAFYKSYPDSMLRWNAALLYFAANMQLYGDGDYLWQARQLIAGALAEKDLPADLWQVAKALQIRDMVVLSRTLMSYDTAAVNLAAIRIRIDELGTRHQQSSKLVTLEREYSELLKQAGRSAELEAFWTRLTASPNPAVAKLARGQLLLARLVHRPVEMKFTGVDGREYDLARLRDKVVLVDFWATWCKPCIEELPALRSLYERYRDKGFEIVGISMDDGKGRDKFLEFLANEKITWPQFLDETRERNRIADEYGITRIPTQLLLDRTGRLVSDNARGAVLEAEVMRLLGR